MYFITRVVNSVWGCFWGCNDVVKVDIEVFTDKIMVKWNTTRKISYELRIKENGRLSDTPIIVNKNEYEFHHKPVRQYEFLVNVVGSNIKVSSESVLTKPTKIPGLISIENNDSTMFLWDDLNKYDQNVHYRVNYSYDGGEPHCFTIKKSCFSLKMKKSTSSSDLQFEVAAVANFQSNTRLCGEYSILLVENVGKLNAQCYLSIQGREINIAYFAQGVYSENNIRYRDYTALNLHVEFYPGCKHIASLCSQIRNSIIPKTISLLYEDLWDRGYIDCAYTLITDSECESDVMLTHIVKSETGKDIKHIDFIWRSSEILGIQSAVPSGQRGRRQYNRKQYPSMNSSGIGSEEGSSEEGSSEEDETRRRQSTPKKYRRTSKYETPALREEDETRKWQAPRRIRSTPKKYKFQSPAISPALREEGNSILLRKSPVVGDGAGTSNSAAREAIVNTAVYNNQCTLQTTRVADNDMNIGGSHNY